MICKLYSFFKFFECNVLIPFRYSNDKVLFQKLFIQSIQLSSNNNLNNDPLNPIQFPIITDDQTFFKIKKTILQNKIKNDQIINPLSDTFPILRSSPSTKKPQLPLNSKFKRLNVDDQ